MPEPSGSSTGTAGNLSKAMISYRDSTFCSGDGCSKFSSCPKALTDDVWEAAEAMGLPVSQYAEPTRLDCWTAPEQPTADEDGASYL